MPLLQGRATVEVIVEKADGTPAFVDSTQGGLLKQGKFELTLDGFSAPVTSGAFAKLVNEGKYDGSELSTGYLTVIGGEGVSPGSTVPLEILPIGVLSLSICLYSWFPDQSKSPQQQCPAIFQ